MVAAAHTGGVRPSHLKQKAAVGNVRPSWSKYGSPNPDGRNGTQPKLKAKARSPAASYEHQLDQKNSHLASISTNKSNATSKAGAARGVRAAKVKTKSGQVHKKGQLSKDFSKTEKLTEKTNSYFAVGS